MRRSGRGVSRLSKQQKEEFVSTFYGINHDTLQVDRVSVTQGGMLYRSGQGVPNHHHPIATGETPQTEIRIVYRLSDLIEIPSHLRADEYSKRRVAELEAKAAQMREERDNDIKVGLCKRGP